MAQCGRFFLLCQEAGGTFGALCGSSDSRSAEQPPPMKMWLHASMSGAHARLRALSSARGTGAGAFPSSSAGGRRGRPLPAHVRPCPAQASPMPPLHPTHSLALVTLLPGATPT